MNNNDDEDEDEEDHEEDVFKTKTANWSAPPSLVLVSSAICNWLLSNWNWSAALQIAPSATQEAQRGGGVW